MNSPDLATSVSRQRKLQDSAVLLPIFGAFLLMSPVITIFSGEAMVFGLPPIFLYIFGVWFGLVLFARAMARRLDKT